MSSKPVVLITGGAVRIGRALAEKFFDNGWEIGIHHHQSDDDAKVLAETFREKGGEPYLCKADLGKEENYKNIPRQIFERYQRLDALILNASLFQYDDLWTCTRESWDRHFEINLRSSVVLCQEFVRLPQDRPRHILFLLDQRVWNLTPYFMSYTLTKSALWTLTQTLAVSLAPNIRVNGIGPGPTLKNHLQTEDSFMQQCGKTPLKNPVSVEDIANAALFLFKTPSITGQMIALDGGQHLGWSFPEENISAYNE